MTKTVEYRVRPVTRYSLTRWESEASNGCSSGGCEQLGEFDSEQAAMRMLEAAANHENKPEGALVTAGLGSILWTEGQSPGLQADR